MPGLAIADLFTRPAAPRALSESFALELDEAIRGQLKRAQAKKPSAPKPPTPSQNAGRATSAGNGEAAKEKEAKAAAAAKVNAAAAELTREKTSAEKAIATRVAKQKAATKDALAQNRAARAERRAKLAAKNQDAPSVGTKTSKVNAQLAHCMLALNRKRGKDAMASWNICRWSLTKFGYLKPPYRENGKVDSVMATQKGSRRAMQHAMEKKPLGGGIPGSPGAKYASFKDLFRDIEPTVGKP